MTDPSSYWSPVCKVVSQLRCWCRMGVHDEDSSWASEWGMLLTIPVQGYLEGPCGPIPFRHVEWVELSTLQLKGAGSPIVITGFVDITDELLSRVRGLTIAWDLRHITWSIDRWFDDVPVQVVHIPNPFGPSAQSIRSE